MTRPLYARGVEKKTTFIAGAAVAGIFAVSLLSTVSFTKEQTARPDDGAPTASPPDHETNIVVPDLVTKETSVAKLSLEGLGFEVDVEETGEPTGLWGEVLEQDPAPGNSLLPGSRVTITSTAPDRQPLDLPGVTRDKKCPADQARHHRNLRVVLGDGRILLGSATESGVVELRGTRTSGATYRVSALWTNDGEYEGDVLVRGDRIDGPGGIEFEQDPEYTPHGPEVHGAPDELHFVRGGPPGRFAWTTVIKYLGGPGCYAFQIEGEDFVETLVVEAASRVAE